MCVAQTTDTDNKEGNYLCVDGGNRHHLHIEHTTMVVHPLHPRQCNLSWKQNVRTEIHLYGSKENLIEASKNERWILPHCQLYFILGMAFLTPDQNKQAGYNEKCEMWCLLYTASPPQFTIYQIEICQINKLKCHFSCNRKRSILRQGRGQSRTAGASPETQAGRSVQSSASHSAAWGSTGKGGGTVRAEAQLNLIYWHSNANDSNGKNSTKKGKIVYKLT